MSNLFIEKSYRNCGGETSSRPFSKFYTGCFYCIPVSYSDVFSYRGIGMGAQKMSPNFL